VCLTVLKGPAVVPDAERKQIRTRVCLFLKKWMEQRTSGDLTPELQMEIMSFIEKNLVADGLQEMQNVLLRVMTGSSTEKVRDETCEMICHCEMLARCLFWIDETFQSLVFQR
jgi:hypothetical protein